MRKTHFTKALCFLLSFCMVFSGIAFAVPAIETVEPSDETVSSAGENTSLNDVGIKPGLNMLTQTTEPYGFETVDTDTARKLFSFYVTGGNAYVESNPAKDSVNGSEKAVNLKATCPSSNDGYPSFRFTFPSALDAKRPIYVSFKYKKTYTPKASEAAVGEEALWVMKGSYIVKSVGGFAFDKNWKQYSGLLDFTTAYNPSNPSQKDTGDTKNVHIQAKVLKSDGTTNFWFDDILYIPSYKATYYLNDGTNGVAQTDYFLLDSDNKIMTSYAVKDYTAKRFGYIFKGWSLNADSTVADAPETIALKNEDIALYAVWEKDPNPTAAAFHWDFSKSSAQTWHCANKGYSLAYQNGLAIVNTNAQAYEGTPYIYHDNVSLNTDTYRYFVMRAKCLGKASSVKFYFKTSDHPSASEDMTVNFALEPETDTFKEFYVDMSTNKYWTSNYTSCMLVINGGGVVEIEDIYFATRPNYECQYLMNDGTDTVVATRYFLLDDQEKLITSYTPDAALQPTRYGYFFKGWALTADATADDVVSTVDVTDKIKLYAVWEKDPDTPEATTYTWDFEDASSQVWKAANKGYSMEYKNGMMIVNTSAEAYEGTPYLQHPRVSLNTKAHRYLVVKARNLNTVNQVRFYFTTSDHPQASDKQTVVIPFEQNSKVFKEYYYDMTQNEYWTGDYQSCMFKFEGGSGVVEIEDIYFTTLYEPKTDEAYEYHYTSGFSAWGHHSLAANADGTYTLTRLNKDTNQGAFNIASPTATLDSSIYSKLVIKAKDANGITGFRVYYSTDKYPGYTIGNLGQVEKTQTSNIATFKDGDYSYYVVDFAGLKEWEGNVKTFMLATTGTYGTIVISDVFMTNKLVPPKSESVEKLALYTTSTEITEDGGEVTIRPYVRYSDGRETTEANFVTDTVNAKLTKNNDGSLTLTGMINGTITVTALINGVEETPSVTINISGQPERMAVNDYRVIVFGNSIARHGASSSIGWNRVCGMAASSEEKDYAHRLQYYMNEKFGANSTTLKVGASLAEFERAIAKNDLTVDYSSLVQTFVDNVVTFEPDVISIQMGENVNTDPTIESYQYAVTALVNALRAAAPDAVIVVCTPFWGGYNRIVGMTNVAEEQDLGLALVHNLNSIENMAYDDPSLKNCRIDENGKLVDAIDGVKRHPGDLGMDRIAKLIFDQANARLSVNDRTEYTTIPKSVEFAADTVKEITKADASVKISATVLPDGAPQSLVWTVSDKNLAAIDKNGVLTAKNNGTVTVTATSRYDETVKNTIEIAISGQTTPYTVTYDANTTDTVTDLPKPNTFAKNTFVFDDGFPVRETYKFLGWATTPDGKPVKSIEITGNITVYAQWELAKSWSFDTDGYKENFTIDNGFNQYVLDGKFMSIATGTNVATGEVLKVNSPKLNLKASDYYALIVTMQNTEISTDTVLDMTIHTTEGDVKFQEKVVTRDYVTYCFKMSKVKGTITGFEFTPTNVDCTINLDEIAFVEQPILGYDENTTNAVSGMPAGEFKSLGEVTVSDAVPTRAGYTFLGWSAAKDSKLLVGSKFNVEKAGTFLYAVWDKNDHWEFDNGELDSVSNVDATKTKVEDGILHYESNSADPIVYVKNLPNYPTSTTSNKIRVKMKWNNAGGVNTTTQIFFRTSTATDLSEANSASTYLNTYGPAPTDWQYIDVDLTQKGTFGGILTYFRFDLTGCKGTNDVDYIRFTDSEANIIARTGKTLKVRTDDWATYLAAEGGTLAPEGSALIKNLYLTGDVDFSNGALIVAENLEMSDANKDKYAVFTLNMANMGVSSTDYMYVGGYDKPVDMKDGAKYLVKLNENGVGFVYFGNKADVSKKVLYKLTSAGAEKMDTTFTTSDTAVSFRTSAPSGVRFRAMVANKLLAAGNATEGFAVKEYGFLVSIGSRIASAEELNMAAVEAGNAVKGIAHNDETDVIYEETPEAQIITAVIVGIPDTKEAYLTDLYVRPYVTLADGTVIYGNPVVDCMYEIAMKLYENMTGDEPYAEYLDKVIETVESN